VRTLLLACLLFSGAVSAEQTPTGLIELLEAGQVAELDRRVDALQARYEAGEADDLELPRALAVFERAIPEWEGAFQRWVQAYPQSYGAHYARGSYFLALGWAHRGEGYSRGTAQSRFSEFSRFTGKSEADLRSSVQLTKKPVASLKRLIDAAIGHGDRALADELYQKALALDRLAFGPRRAYLWGLQPKWGGSVEQMNAFLATARGAGLPAEQVRELEADYWIAMSDMADSAGDTDGALEQARRAVGSGEFPAALIERGRVHHRRREYTQAIADFSSAIEKRPQANPRVYRQRAWAYEAARRFPEAAADYRAAAERGDATAQTRLGGAYNNGELGVKKDFAEAFRWYRRAAGLGDPFAQSYIAQMYYLGEGVKLSYPDAAKWASASAGQKNPGGQTALGIILWYGNGLPQDQERAIDLWRAAARNGDAAAKTNLERLPSAWQKARIWTLDARDAVLPVPRE
jgi:TPR repeat protein